MLLYLLFWTILGFIFHFYIIFGTNLLTGGPAQNCCFCLFQSFRGKEYQTESKRNETFGNVIFSPNVIQETWTLLQGIKEVVTRVGGAPLGHAPLPRGPPGGPPTPTPTPYIGFRGEKNQREEIIVFYDTEPPPSPKLSREV